MGGDVCCSDTDKNNQSVHVYIFFIKDKSYYLQLLSNNGKRRGINTIDTFEFHTKRDNSFDKGNVQLKNVRKIIIIKSIIIEYKIQKNTINVKENNKLNANEIDNTNNNPNIEISSYSNKKSIKFLDSINNNKVQYLDYAGGLDENNHKNGFGILHFSDGSIFKGIFSHGHANGLGIFCHSSGDKYEGEFNNDIISGYGEYHFQKISVSSGYWVDSELDGIGIEKWQDSFYYGQFSKGKKEGIGKYLWKNRCGYEGEWKNDNMDGYGIYHFSDGRKYLGEWKNNYMEGFGIYIWNNGKKYYGFFKKGLKHGFGIFYLLNDKFVIGFWKEGKQNGFVKHINGNKITYGILSEGKIGKFFKNEEEFWNDFIDNEYKKYKNFFQLDKSSIYNYINSIEEQFINSNFFQSIFLLYI